MPHLSLQPMRDGEDFVNQRNQLTPNQVQNNASGFSYAVDDMTRLVRFLIMGSENGAYYQQESEPKKENVLSIGRLIVNGKGNDVVETIRDVSVSGRACKQNSTVYALAVCARSNDPDTKKAAYSVLSDVCRTPTDLFFFIRCCENESAGTGWGRAHRRAVGGWYNNYSEEPLKLAMHVTKYRRRNDWKHKDVLRLAHLKPKTPEVGFVVKYILEGFQASKDISLTQTKEDKHFNKLFSYLEAVENASRCKEEHEMAGLIRKHSLVREHVPTKLLKSVSVWKALLERMPMSAMIKNLGKMASMNMFVPNSKEERTVCERLTNQRSLKESRIHPFEVLVAMNTYKVGASKEGKLIWPPNQRIIDTLDKSFCFCFENVIPTGKRFLLAVNVSESMTSTVLGTSSVTARDSAAAMMMVTAKVEKSYEVVAFSNGLQELNIKANNTLPEVLDKFSSLPSSETDCSAPMLYAIEQKKEVDVFVVYTDSETHFGRLHPSQAIAQYRKWSGIFDARLIVVGMASNGFSIADPEDRYMMDVVGFDTGAPEAVREFIMDFDLTEVKTISDENID